MAHDRDRIDETAVPDLIVPFKRALYAQIVLTFFFRNFLCGHFRAQSINGNAVIIDDLSFKLCVLCRDAVAVMYETFTVYPAVQFLIFPCRGNAYRQDKQQQ